MAIQNLTLFMPRRNRDGSLSSICRTCFSTIGPRRYKEELEEMEDIHVCEDNPSSRRYSEEKLATPQTDAHASRLLHRMDRPEGAEEHDIERMRWELEPDEEVMNASAEFCAIYGGCAKCKRWATVKQLRPFSKPGSVPDDVPSNRLVRCVHWCHKDGPVN
jgi:hypothetical protein